MEQQKTESPFNRAARREALVKERRVVKKLHKGYTPRKIARDMGFINVDVAEENIKEIAKIHGK